MIKKDKKKSKQAIGVQIGVLGSFDESGLSILKKYSTISRTKDDVVAEIQWLDGIDCISDINKAKIGTELWQNKPTAIVLKRGPKAIDVESFSYLALERYIDNMAIDLCICEFLEQSYNHGRKDTVYLPSEVWDWLSSGDEQFISNNIKSALSKLEGNKLKQVLAPVHMPNHLGLVYVDVEGKAMYFDDGLRLIPGEYVLEGVKSILGVIKKLHPHHVDLASEFWEGEGRFQRFGMPSQTTHFAKRTGNGAGSCGVGVIKSAKDFIDSGPLAKFKFTWSYADMKDHRLELMLLILRWKDCQSLSSLG